MTETPNIESAVAGDVISLPTIDREAIEKLNPELAPLLDSVAVIYDMVDQARSDVSLDEESWIVSKNTERQVNAWEEYSRVEDGEQKRILEIRKKFSGQTNIIYHFEYNGAPADITLRLISNGGKLERFEIISMVKNTDPGTFSAMRNDFWRGAQVSVDINTGERRDTFDKNFVVDHFKNGNIDQTKEVIMPKPLWDQTFATSKVYDEGDKVVDQNDLLLAYELREAYAESKIPGVLRRDGETISITERDISDYARLAILYSQRQREGREIPFPQQRRLQQLKAKILAETTDKEVLK